MTHSEQSHSEQSHTKEPHSKQPHLKPVVLCADDFGMSTGINRAILNLCHNGRLSAVSCMTDMPCWQQDAPALLELRGPVSVGLHFNLTEGSESKKLPQLMQQALTGRIDKAWVSTKLRQQLDAFAATTGSIPDFIDGHQHVHIFPGIRDVLLDTLHTRYSGALPWIRQVRPELSGHDARLKAIILQLMGRGFVPATGRYPGLQLSAAFAGLYSLQPDADFAALLEGWLNQLPAGGLIMCHPGDTDPASTSGMALTRRKELTYLASDAFANLLQRCQVQLSPQPALISF